MFVHLLNHTHWTYIFKGPSRKEFGGSLGVAAVSGCRNPLRNYERCRASKKTTIKSPQTTCISLSSTHTALPYILTQPGRNRSAGKRLTQHHTPHQGAETWVGGQLTLLLGRHLSLEGRQAGYCNSSYRMTHPGLWRYCSHISGYSHVCLRETPRPAP